MLFTVVMFLTGKNIAEKKEKENNLRAHLYGISSINGGRVVH